MRKLKILALITLALAITACAPFHELKSPCGYEAKFCGKRTPVNQ